MEVYQVRVFLEVARHLSFTEAGDALNLTQPAVSAKIKSLETELGTPLFYRLGRKIQLTEAGQYLLEAGVDLVAVEERLVRQIAEIKNGKIGKLIVGCTPAIAAGWLPDKLFEYGQRYPDIQTQCVICESAELLYRAIASGEVDLGLAELDFAEFTEIAAAPVAAMHYRAVVASHHPLAAANWLSLKELRGEAWVLPPSTSPAYHQLEQRLAELNLGLADFTQVATADAASFMRAHIMRGQAIGFATSLEFQTECRAGEMVAIPLQEFALHVNIYLAQLRRVSEFNDRHVERNARRHHGVNPVQQFVALVQPAEAGASHAFSLRSPNVVSRAGSSRGSNPEVISLAIGIQSGTIPTVTAGSVIQELGLLEHFLPRDGRYGATQYQIRWHDYASGAPIVEGLAAGTLDIGVLGDYPLLLSAAAGDRCPTRLVSFVSTNPDGCGNAVIVPQASHAQCLEDLCGKKIAVPFGSSAHGMVVRSLHAANLLADVELEFLSQETFQNTIGQTHCLVDGYAQFAPFHLLACRQGAYRYLRDDRLNQLPSFHGVVMRAALCDRYPEVAIAYLQALKAAQHWYASHPTALDRICQWTRMDADAIRQLLAPGRFFLETQIRTDWLREHIAQLSCIPGGIPGNERFGDIDLHRWVQSDLLRKSG